MWKKENPPADPVGSFKIKPESKEAPKMPKADKPEPEGRSTAGYTALHRSAARKDSVSHEPTLVSAQSTMNGEISGQSDVRICGNFQGTIDVPKNQVTVELSGYAKATINAQSISVHGKVFGTITASDTIHLLSSGNVDGDIRAANVILDKGCTFNGAIEMVREKKQEKTVKSDPKSSAQTQARIPPASKPAQPAAQKAQESSS